MIIVARELQFKTNSEKKKDIESINYDDDDEGVSSSSSPQRYMSSPVRRTNTKATHRGIIILMWTAADPSDRS